MIKLDWGVCVCGWVGWGSRDGLLVMDDVVSHVGPQGWILYKPIATVLLSSSLQQSWREGPPKRKGRGEKGRSIIEIWGGEEEESESGGSSRGTPG
jgi:hypothetical protein